MERNLFRRVETAFPIEDPKLKATVIAQGLQAYLDDNTQAWRLNSEGEYERIVPPVGERSRSAQSSLLARLSS
jgi:polyphosphate kinase